MRPKSYVGWVRCTTRGTSPWVPFYSFCFSRNRSNTSRRYILQTQHGYYTTRKLLSSIVYSYQWRGRILEYVPLSSWNSDDFCYSYVLHMLQTRHAYLKRTRFPGPLRMCDVYILSFWMVVVEVGFEPTQLKGNGFTDRPDSPSSAPHRMGRRHRRPKTCKECCACSILSRARRICQYIYIGRSDTPNIFEKINRWYRTHANMHWFFAE